MIYYFSGTGNSRFVAEQIAYVTGKTAESLHPMLRQTETPYVFSSAQSIVFVVPVYAWRIPRIISNMIEQASFTDAREVYFVLTCGDSAGNAVAYAQSLCDENNLQMLGCASVVMPENYIALFETPETKEARGIIYQSLPKILKIAQHIASGEPFPAERKKGVLLSAWANPIFYRFFVRAEGFRYTDKCIACGKCAPLCPLHNISLDNGQPIWGNKCTHCMACIAMCPEDAIEYKNATKNKPRYLLDETLTEGMHVQKLMETT